MKERPKYHASWVAGLLFVCLLSLAPFASLWSQNGQSSYERKIERDAARLALRFLMENDGPELDEIEVPQTLWDKYNQVLLNIYNKNPTAKALEACNVHTSPDLSVDHLILIVKKNAAWARPLKNGGARTGSTLVNGFIDRYDIHLNLVNWDDEHDAVVINSERPLNIAALAAQIRANEEVVKLGKNKLNSRGNDIQVKQIPGGWEVVYIYRFGPQFGNAGKEHRWIYNYSNAGTVKLLEEKGDDIPSWTPCFKSLTNPGPRH